MPRATLFPLLSILGAALAAPRASAVYVITNIADTTMSAPTGLYTNFFQAQISGTTVAAQGSYTGGNRAIFTGSGGPLTVIAKNGDPAPTGTFSSLDTLTYAGGDVIFSGRYNSNMASGHFRGSGGPLTTIVKAGDPAPSGTWTSLGAVATVGGPIAFSGVHTGVPLGVFSRATGGAVTTIAKHGDPYPTGGNITGFGQIATSGGDTAFIASSGSSALTGIFKSAGGPRTTMIKTGDPAPTGTFTFISGYSFSDGMAAVLATYSSSQTGIFTADGVTLTTIAKTGDPAPTGTFTAFSQIPSIRSGRIAFVGAYGSVTWLFVKDGASLTEVIKTGDTHFGQSLNSIAISAAALDHTGTGNLAFHYTLGDGRIGVALAILVVPEAPAWLMLGAVTAAVVIPLKLVRKRPGPARPPIAGN